MEKKVYLVYEFSKGRKDLVMVSENLDTVVATVRYWSSRLELLRFKYRVYECPCDTPISFDKYAIYDYCPVEIKY